MYTVRVVNRFLSAQLSQHIFTRPFIVCNEGCGLETRVHCSDALTIPAENSWAVIVRYQQGILAL